MSVLLLFLLWGVDTIKAQSLSKEWLLLFDGSNDTYLADIALDDKGNTYVAINCTSDLTLPGLNIKLPYAPHVHSLIAKISNNGKILWCHAIRSSFDNRINDIHITDNGCLYRGWPHTL